MTTPHRRRNFGDVGANAPEGWLWGGPNTPSVDLLLLLFARDEAALDQLYATVSATFAGGGVAQVQRLDAIVDLDGKEHFGFADGISQPTIDGLSSRTDIPPTLSSLASSSSATSTNTVCTPTDRYSIPPPTRARCCRRMWKAAARRTSPATARTWCFVNCRRTCAASGASSMPRPGRPTAR